MKEFPVFGSEGLTAAQQIFWDEITKGPKGFATGGPAAKHLPGLYNAWLPFPEFGLMMSRLGDEIRAKGGIEGKLREMVVITTSKLLNSALEYKVHSVFAKVEGLSESVIKAIGEGVTPHFSDEAERIVYEANVELIKTSTLKHETRAALVELLGVPGFIQFIALVGLYVIVSYTVNVADIELPEDFKLDEDQVRAFLKKSKPAQQ
jgi:alkylhydroperoxidase family enzyme